MFKGDAETQQIVPTRGAWWFELAVHHQHGSALVKVHRQNSGAVAQLADARRCQ